MRLIELEIQRVRGIHDLHLDTRGGNLVIWGPNGSGKSAVVDAIDFLLTGQISRLTGKGTGDIKLDRHGPHIDHKPDEAVVRALVQLPGLGDPIEIKRSMQNPSKLECDLTDKTVLDPIMDLARRGQHVLTRRDILKYITADASTRAKEVQELLNINEIEEVRKTLVTVNNDMGREAKGAERAVEIATAQINATVQEPTFDEHKVLNSVNTIRKDLNGQPISTLSSELLKTNITPPAGVPDVKTISIDLLEKDVQNLRLDTLENNKQQIAQTDTQLRKLLTTIRSDPQLLRDLSRLSLTELGLTLIDETGGCPLCDTSWPPGELREYLNKRIIDAEVVVQQRESIVELSTTIAGFLNNAVASIQKVVKAANVLNLESERLLLQSWLDGLQGLSNALGDPLEKYPDPRFKTEEVQMALASTSIEQALTKIYSNAEAAYPKTTPEQRAWDTLTRLEENLKGLENASEELKNALLLQKRAGILLESFLKARDNILGSLYDEIRDRFVNLYRQLHGPEEDKFHAKIAPEEAGLNLGVDFYGRGIHPPHALHSEGHQDSMGICLYLALNERLTEGLIDLVILDDVVMSVDTDHRRQVCNLLATSFSDRQFLITTHDKTWAHQLKSAGVVDSKGILEFYNWHVETGPQVNFEADMWERIEGDLKENNVPTAAARLRRGSEQFFWMVCDALQAKVTCKLDGKWELGDFLPAAMARYLELLRRAKRSANSWGDRNRIESLEESESIAETVFARTRAEQWAVNVNIHYNNWSNFTKEDFQPVQEAFQDLYALFVCNNCGGILRIATTGITATAVLCNCGRVNWNLKEKDGRN